jgi:hypothetical protein
MLRRVAVARTDVSEELSASTIRLTKIAEPGTALAVTSNRRTLRKNTKKYEIRRNTNTDCCHPDDEGTKFLRNVGSYKRHTE